ncbi:MULTISPECIES: hypothetical protein [Burkholderia]|jgi:hypothetical protein|uniref:Uncharacterized protein n=1 Tax=Burkholderia contaminans TaxID=488447 RepID=A0A1E3FNZ4_9BURK|nr:MULTISPECIES: hypothetical protein [Burkholderia]MBA9831874.1 hypothetical protein [Burkholderia contaminans]MBA9841245.1 hypothetical protein [Burkholderia contaminans]MBA9865039.1 hypothetical protein [Burkholderia contaminans]MBA9907927.1 hypothetical protein [Burkholderia contaminans]MBA9931011.1 hypothetical protein [Burkholderia contaminans]
MSLLRPTLPEKENGTYFILPKAGEPPQVGAEPDAWQMVAKINPAYLEFNKTARTSFRPMNLLISIWGGGLFFLGLLPTAIEVFIDVDRLGIDGVIIFSSMLLISLGVAIGVPYRQLRQPQSPILLSRRLRRFYQWQGKKTGWTVLDYNRVVPYVTRLTVVSTAGTDTSFFLDVGVLEPGTRKLAQFIRLSDPAVAVLPPAELWEFVRAYMDGPPAKVPPIEYRIPEGQEHGIHARMDRDMIAGLLDKEHRLRPGLFYKLYFGISAMIGYWSDRLIPWMERRIPHPPLPPELAEAMQWEGENPYRMNPPCDIEQKAIDGELLYMNRRWFIGMLLSTLMWGGSFVGMVAVGWWMAFDPSWGQ